MIGNQSMWASWARRSAGMVMAAACAVAIASCGGGEQPVALSQQEPSRVPTEAQTTVASTAALVPSAQEEGEVVASADSLPPEVAVEVADTTVEPGEAFEITAIGSDDVRDVLLTDGRGTPTSFAYDLPSKAWKAHYRVPMKVQGDRIGLSVTAKNDSRRWRRVWLFLQVHDPRLSQATGPDSLR